MPKLNSKQVTLVVGHPEGDGAPGERAYNTDLAYLVAEKLERLGADVYIHWHTIHSYETRMDVMRDAVNEQQPDCECCVEFHYNAYHKESANGHEFFYRGCKRLADCFEKHFSKAFPWSHARSGGVKPLMSGNGSGFLKEAPAWACLVEPFFFTNKKEMEFFAENKEELAVVYTESIEEFILTS
jgi:N-acetylmuramoyl-L-alanine amidase